jgi:hypothetical protein
MMGLHNAGRTKRTKWFETDLKAILTSITTACDVHVNTFEWNERASPERQGAQVV